MTAGAASRRPDHFRPMPDTRVTNRRFRKLPFVQGDLSIPVISDAKIKSFASG